MVFSVALENLFLGQLLMTLHIATPRRLERTYAALDKGSELMLLSTMETASNALLMTRCPNCVNCSKQVYIAFEQFGQKQPLIGRMYASIMNQ